MQTVVDSKFVVRIILVVLAVAILYVLIVNYNKDSSKITKEKFTRDRVKVESKPAMYGSNSRVTEETKPDVVPSEPVDSDQFKGVDFETDSKLPTNCFPRDKLTAEDLLPKDSANSKWAQVAPSNEDNKNFLTAGHMVGIDTIGQSMRNANYQLRSDIPIARFAVGPWNQSTIEFDSSRRFFEIGSEEC